MSKPVLLIITSSSCGHCKTYKQNNEKAVMEMLGREHLATVYQINDGVISPSARINPNLNKYIRFVPTFILLTKESWEGNGPLFGSIMNQKIGYESGKEFIQTSQAKQEFFNTSEGVKDWIVRELRNNPIFNSNVPKSFNAFQNENNPSFKIVPLESIKKEHGFHYKDDSSSESD